ncbi:hypothetical protein KBD45_00375 [Candidatus Dojkabacteria bacterium]|nr:hypothetical protein [Candidatus Dojkabacteria bacterium]
MNIFKPEIFQGKLHSKHYFEGWYFKNVSKNLGSVYSFILGISLNSKKPHAFIQVINGITGDTKYIEYPISKFSFSKDKFEVKVGDSVFSSKYIQLNIDSPTIKIKGKLEFSEHIKYPSSPLSPGILGWFSFIPFMECMHAVVSISHKIEGSLEIEGKQIDFSDGKGYIEKDWGKSFPESWIWLQSNHFSKSDASIMMSIAKVPMLGIKFTGYLGFFYYKAEIYTFRSYNGSKLSALSLEKDKLKICFKNRKIQLDISATLKNSGILLAPKFGEMSREIKESVNSDLEVKLSDSKGNLIYHDKASRAGLEIVEGIL